MRPLAEWVLFNGRWFLLVGFDRKTVRILIEGNEMSIPKHDVDGWKLA